MPRAKEQPRTFRPQDGTWNTLVEFRGCTDSMESIFGTDDISPGQVSRLIWQFIKQHKLSQKTIAPARLAGVDRTPRRVARPLDPIDDVRTYKRRQRA